jgi:hypothetical protein
MSPTPSNPEDLQQIAKDGVVTAALGSVAMVCRLILSTEPVTAGWVVRRVFAAAVTSAFVGWAVADQIHSESLRFACVGAAGYCAPEVLDYVLRYARALKPKR